MEGARIKRETGQLVSLHESQGGVNAPLETWFVFFIDVFLCSWRASVFVVVSRLFSGASELDGRKLVSRSQSSALDS